MAEIKKIQLPGITTPYDLCDEYARKRIEGLSTVYTISCEHTTGGTFVDWDTEASVTVTAANVKNSAFKSTADQITVSGSGAGDYYLVLESKSSGVNYAKQMTKMAIGDTIYVKEDISVAADRWLSSVDVSSGSITAKFDALSGKIDLSEYALKTEAGKAGTYTTSDGGAGSTGSAGSQTATGTATVTYKLADSATGSAGGATVTSAAAGGATITSSSAGAQTITSGSAGGATVDFSNASFTGTSATVTVSAEAVTLEDHSYTPAGTVSAVSAASHSHTINAATDSVTAVTAINAGTASFTQGTDSFTANVPTAIDTTKFSGGSFTQGSKASYTGHTFTAGSLPSFTQGTKAKLVESGTTVTATNIMSKATVSAEGVLSWTNADFTANGDDTWSAGSLPTHNVGTFTANGDDSFTAATLATGFYTAGSAATFTQGTDSFSYTAPSVKSTKTCTYVTSATTSLAGAINVTPTFTGTAATLAHGVTATTGTVEMSGTFTPAGSVSGTQTIAAHTHSVTVASHTHSVTVAAHSHSVTVGSHTHAIGLTDTQITGTASVAVSSHTHTLGNHTHSVTVSAVKAS